MAKLNIRVLGPLQATLDGAPLGLESNKVRALLVYLAMEGGHPHSREVLAEMFWPDQPQRLAMNNLRYALADLRSHIEKYAGDPLFLTITHDTAQFNPCDDARLDAMELKAIADAHHPPGLASIAGLERAASLYQGSFLEGFSVRNSAPFEEWMLAQREELTRCGQKVLSALADHYESHGRFAQALQFARRRLETEPLDEDGYQQVMRLLAFDGQRSAALAQYETCKALLRGELNIAPSAQSTALYESIRDGALYIPMHFAASAAAKPEALFVAREEELSALTRRLKRALAGQGCVAFVTGEAGSGKTTLVKEFIRRSSQAHPDLVALYGNCNSFAGSIDPYLPFIEVFKMLAGDMDTQQASGAAEQERSRRIWEALPVVIRALIECGPDLIDRFVPGEELLARARTLEHFQTNGLEQLVRGRAGAVRGPEPGAGSHGQSQLFEQVGSVIRAVSHAHPILIALDDLQWADPDTVNLFFYLCRRLGGSQIMIIGTYRFQNGTAPMGAGPSPFFPALRELQAVSEDAALDLSRSDARHFVNSLLDSERNALGEEFRAALVQHTAGIPLFVVELVRGMRERGGLVQDEAGRWVANPDLDWEVLPPRVEAVIAQQAEALPGEWQHMLSVASVEGDEFSAEIVASVLDERPEELVSRLSGPLSRLHNIVVPLGIQRAGGAGKRLSRYRFRHHLFQRYFESSQDAIERASLHEAVGKALEAFYDGQTDEIAIPLARHFELANLRKEAASYLLIAGKKAQRLFANDEAIEHFQRGLNLLAFLPERVERDRLELQLQIALGQPIIATQGHNAAAIEQAYSRARQLVERCGDRKDLFQVLSLLKSYYNLRGDRKNSEETARAMLQIAEETGDGELLVIAAIKMVTNSFYYGQWADFQTYVDRTIQLYDPERHRALALRTGGDPKGQALALGAVGFWMLGFPDRARQYAEAALVMEREVAIPVWSWFAYYYAASFHIYAEDLSAARHWIDKALHVCREQGMSHYLPYMESMLGWLMARTGDRSGISKLERGTAWVREIGDLMNLLPLLRLLADAYCTHGLVPEGLEAVEEGLAMCRQTGMVYDEPELWRLKGELMLLAPGSSTAAAEEAFLRAIDAASAQGTKMWELRATVSLARLWMQQGQWEPARCRLEKLYSWFTEGFETRDLWRAKNLLEGIPTPEA